MVGNFVKRRICVLFPAVTLRFASCDGETCHVVCGRLVLGDKLRLCLFDDDAVAVDFDDADGVSLFDECAIGNDVDVLAADGGLAGRS